MEQIQSAVLSAAEQEIRLRSSFDEDRRRLDTTLSKSRILIDRAERWSFKDARLPQILTQLKDAAYDAEDVLADIDYEEDQQKKIQGQQSQVSQLLHYPLNFAHRLMDSTPKRVRTIQGRLDMTADNLQGLMDQLGLHGDYSMPANRQTSSVVGETKVYGRDEDREKVIELLGIQRGQGNNGTDINESVSVPALRRKKENVSVVSIYGIGGVGKTTLAQIVYNDQRVPDHFDLKIWICVSDNFHVENLSKQIIDNAGKGYNTDPMNLNSLQETLKKIAKENRFLLILDDVWNENWSEWQKFYRPLSCGKEGSMILVTTRTKKIANITGTADPILLEGLSGNVYQEFFKSCAFGRKNPKDYPQLENIGRNIAAKLKGSPLAAKTIGSLLNEDMDEGHWTRILNSELWELPQEEGDILPALRLSYQYLPPHLKRCFSFCSVFPKDYQFNKNELVSIWVALGFVIPHGNMLLEDIATMYLHDLTSRGFFQQSDRDPQNYVMHDLIHDLAQFVSADECSRIDRDRDSGKLNILETVRHLSICCADIEENMLMELRSYHKLRSLIILNFLSELDELDSVIDCLISKLTYIRCLKIESFEVTKLPESISNLKHLKYLDVSSTSIRTLPESLCRPNNLQVLNIINCMLECFPQGLTRLHNLRKLYAEKWKLSKISKIGGLTSLQYLPEFEVPEDDQHKIGELKHMTELRGSLCITKLENVGSPEDARQAKLDNKKYLDKLILKWSLERENFDHDMEVLEGLQPRKELKQLKIRNYGGTTSPSWLQNLKSLTSLKIRKCPHVTSLPEQVMRQLKSLEELSIRSCEELSSLGGLDALASLKVITILECPKLADSEPPTHSKLAGSEPPMFNSNNEVQRADISLFIDKIALLKLQSFRNLAPFIKELSIGTEPVFEYVKYNGEGIELLCSLQSLRNLEFGWCCVHYWLPTKLHRLALLQSLSFRSCTIAFHGGRYPPWQQNGQPAKLDLYSKTLSVPDWPENDGLPASLKNLYCYGCHPVLSLQLEKFISKNVSTIENFIVSKQGAECSNTYCNRRGRRGRR